MDRVERSAVDRLELEEELAELNRLSVADVDLPDDALELGLDLVHQLHRLEDAQRLTGRDRIADLDERRRPRRGCSVERADHRAFDANERVVARLHGLLVRLTGRCNGCGLGVGRLSGASDADTHAVFLDRDLPHAGLLHDPHDLADPLLACLVDTARGERLVTAGTLADRTEQRLCLLAEEREQEQLFLARGQTACLGSQRVEIDGRFGLAAEVLDRTGERRVDGTGRAAEAPADQIAQLVDHRRVAVRREHVQQRLRSDDLADRSGERRRADLLAHPADLLDHLVEAVARRL